MPKSKRARVVTLSRTEKKGKESKNDLFDGIRQCIEEYDRVFVFEVDNMRNTYLKEVRSEFSDSRIYFGKTKVMAKALGSTRADEHRPNLSQLSKYLVGNVGLLFTKRSTEEVIAHFAAYRETDFARAGVVASRSFTIPAGILYSTGGEIAEDDDVPLAHSLEPSIRALGVPTRLIRGKVVLDSPHPVCAEGDILNSQQTRLLKMFGIATSEFKVNLIAYWDASSEVVAAIDAMEE